MTTKNITLIRRERPFRTNPREQIQWILECMGVPKRFVSEYADVLMRLAESEGENISTGTLADEKGIKRTSLSYHIGRMVEMGVIVREGRTLRLRASNFERTVEEIERDVIRMFEDLKKVAREIDESLGLPRR